MRNQITWEALHPPNSKQCEGWREAEYNLVGRCQNHAQPHKSVCKTHDPEYVPRRWTDDELDQLVLWHGEGYTLKDIGDTHGVSASRIGQLVRKRRAQMKEAVNV